jgi:hypothetical protein
MSLHPYSQPRQRRSLGDRRQDRDCERAGDFEQQFIELGRSVYEQTDRRASIKRRLNERLGSEIIDEKLLPCRMGRMGRMIFVGLTPICTT